VSATASLGAKLVSDLHVAISACGTLERDLTSYNVEAQAQAGTHGVMPPGRKVDAGKVNRSLQGLNSQLGECQSKADAAAAAKPISPIAAEVRQPRSGEWYCDLDLDQDTVPQGKIKFQLDDIEFTGTVEPESSGTDGARARCKVMAGNGRIRRPVKSHSYSGSGGVRVGTIVRDILKDCGEDLSDLSDADTLDKKLPRWHVASGVTAANALTRLAKACSGSWRMLRDGTVWFGTETWPEVAPEGLPTSSGKTASSSWRPSAPTWCPGPCTAGSGSSTSSIATVRSSAQKSTRPATPPRSTRPSRPSSTRSTTRANTRARS
jgi:hypothetical protein